LKYRKDYDAMIEAQKAEAKRKEEERKRAQELMNFEAR